MRAIDEHAINTTKIPSIVLMENAASEVCSAIYSIEGHESRNFLIITGPGKNGGDGFAIARKLINKGIAVKILTLSPTAVLKGDSKINYDILKNIGAEVSECNDTLTLKHALTHCDFVIDAIFGTGLGRPIEGLYRSAIDLINSSEKYVIAVDIPSGVDSDTGKSLGIAVMANLTVTFAYEKIGQVIYPGKEQCGNVVTADIGIPDAISQKVGIGIKNFIVKESDMRRLILHLKRKDNTHKGDFGHALVIAGSKGKTGAAAMTATAALRMGAGLVTMAVPESLNPIFEEKVTEVMTEPVGDIDGFFSEDAYGKIMELTEKKSVIIIGPGTSTHPETARLVKKLIAKIKGIPVVIDADGLNIIAEDVSILKDAKTELILTPHPAEMARLVGMTTAEVLGNKIAIARKFAVDNSVTLILKGADTIIATKDEKIHVNSTGNSALSTAGTGDVLTGMVGGALAQGLNVLRSCIIGTYVHGAVGDEISEKFGRVGIIATDLLGVIPSVIHKLSS